MSQGAKYTLVRRKPNADCLNTPAYSVNLTQTETCACTLADTGEGGGSQIVSLFFPSSSAPPLPRALLHAHPHPHTNTQS